MDTEQQLQIALTKAMDAVPQCLACALTNLDFGLQAFVQRTDHPADILRLTSAALMTQLEGDEIRTIGRLVAEHYGRNEEPVILEMSFTTERTLHVMIRSKEKPRLITTFVCSIKANKAVVEARGHEAAKAVFAAA